MKNALFIFLMATALLACKGSETKGGNESGKGGEVGLGGLTVPGERNFTSDELVIAKRICSALQKKREFFEKLKDQQEQVQLSGENRNCAQVVYNSSAFVAKVSNASSSDLQYISTNRTNYLNDIITDQSSSLKSFCEDISVMGAVSNTTLVGSSYLIINVLISNGFDRFEITKKTRDASGKYPIVSMEGMNVYTKESQIDKKFIGTEQERIRYVACSGSTNSSYVKQNWLKAMTAF